MCLKKVALESVWISARMIGDMVGPPCLMSVAVHNVLCYRLVHCVAAMPQQQARAMWVRILQY